MYILEGAFNTHLKTDHNIGVGITHTETRTKKSNKKAKATKPEVVCQYCSKKYTSANLLEKHEKVHGKLVFIFRIGMVVSRDLTRNFELLK